MLEQLDILETCLETPFVPGELPAWFDAVAEALTSVEAVLRRQTQRVHPEEFAQILAQDPALQPCIEKLEHEDRDILKGFDAMRAQADRVAKRAAEIEPDEARIKPDAQAFAEWGLALIIRVRKQETAIRTWFLEAIDRDRGTVD